MKKDYENNNVRIYLNYILLVDKLKNGYIDSQLDNIFDEELNAIIETNGIEEAVTWLRKEKDDKILQFIDNASWQIRYVLACFPHDSKILDLYLVNDNLYMKIDTSSSMSKLKINNLFVDEYTIIFKNAHIGSDAQLEDYIGKTIVKYFFDIIGVIEMHFVMYDFSIHNDYIGNELVLSFEKIAFEI